MSFSNSPINFISDEIPVISRSRASSICNTLVPVGQEGSVVVKNSFLTIVQDDSDYRPERRCQSIDLAFLNYKMENLMMTVDAEALGLICKDVPSLVVSISTSEGEEECTEFRPTISTGCCCDNHSDDISIESEEPIVFDEESSEPQSLLESWRLSIVQQRIQHEHMCGECKPCAFFHSAKGCNNGASCNYCHEEHDAEYVKLAAKRNRAKRLALLWAMKEADEQN
jgi:hypothetical protein